MKILKYYCLLILLVAGFFFVYFVKCQLDICLIKDFPLDKYPPLSLLQSRNPYHIIHAPRANVDLFSNRFDFEAGIGKWEEKLWMQEKGMVTLESDPKGHGNSSSLLITSRSAKAWSLGAKKLIQVNPGEVYSFSGWVRTSGLDPLQKDSGMTNKAVGSLSVSLYDSDRHVEQWDYAMESVTRAENWKKVDRKFIVPINVRYIRFQLSGRGEGKLWFAEIKFNKE